MLFSFSCIDHVQLTGPKGCEEKARSFYNGVLGLKEIPKPSSVKSSGGCWFAIGTQEIHIGIEDPFTPPVKAHPAFVIQNIEELRSHLKEQAIEIKEDRPIAGRTRFFVRDPFGNRLEFLEYE